MFLGQNATRVPFRAEAQHLSLLCTPVVAASRKGKPASYSATKVDAAVVYEVQHVGVALYGK